MTQEEELELMAAIRVVRSHGLLVKRAPDGPWLKLTELPRVQGLSDGGLYGRLGHSDCPRVPQFRGPDGKLVAVLPTQSFLDWLMRPIDLAQVRKPQDVAR